MQILKNKFTIFLYVLLAASALSFYYSNALYTRYVKYKISQSIHQISQDFKINIDDVNIKRSFFQYFVTLEDITINDEMHSNEFTAKKILIHLRWKSIFSKMRFIKISVIDSNVSLGQSQPMLQQLKSILDKGSHNKLEFANDFSLFFMNVSINNNVIDYATLKPSSQKIDLFINVANNTEKIAIEYEDKCCKNIEIKFLNANYSKQIFAPFWPKADAILKSNLKLTGQIKIKNVGTDYIFEGHIEEIHGTYQSRENFLIKDGKLDLSYANNVISLNNVDVIVDGANFVGNINHENNDWIIEGNVHNAEPEVIKRFWPNNIAPNLKGWLSKSINAGRVISSYIFIDTKNNTLVIEDAKFSEVDFALPISNNVVILKASSGTFQFKHDKFNLIVENTQIENVKLKFNLECHLDKEVSNYIVNVNGRSNGHINNIHTIINQALKLPINESNIMEHGILDSSFKIKLEIDQHTHKITIHKNIDATIKNFKIKGIYNIFDITTDLIKINIENNKLNFNSKSLINDKKVNWKGEYDLEHDDIEVDLEGGLSLEDVKKLPFMYNINFLQGDADGKIKLQKKNNNYSIKSSLFFTKDNVNLTYFMLPESPNIENTTVFFDISFSSPTECTYLINLKGKNIDAMIKGQVNNKHNIIESEKFILNDNKVTFKYTELKNKILLNLKGNYLNMSQFKVSHITDINSNKKANISANFDRVLLKNNVFIGHTILQLNDNIINSNFSSTFEQGGYISGKVNDFGFDLNTDNAGLLLKALDITDSIRYGKLDFHLDASNKLRTKPGMLVINHFFVTKASILTQILSLASFVGLIDVLNGDGIRFNKLVAPIKYSDNIIYFEESWAEGEALGISFKGPVNFAQEEMILYGTMVPIYKLNKLIWNIPIIGKIITGGKTRGIVAASYTIKKQDGKTAVNVDPLSTLTPTILQRIFELFK